MSKVIEGTELFTPPYDEYTAADTAKKRDQIIVDFMRRIANHTHNGVDSQRASLPIRVSKSFEAGDLTFNSANNLYSFDLNLELSTQQINAETDTISFYYQPNVGAIDDAAWTRFYPTFSLIDSVNIIVYSLLNNIHIKVSA